MQSLLKASFLLFVLLVASNSSFALTVECKIKTGLVSGVDSIHLTDETLLINGETEIPLEKSTINCGHFKRRIRLDGNALGYQIILKSCTSEALLKGDLIDSVNGSLAELECN